MFGCAFVGMRRAAARAPAPVGGADAGPVRGGLRVPLRLPAQPVLLAFSTDPNSSIAYLPGLPFTEQWHRYLLFDLATSLGWDTGRAVTTGVAVLVVGPAVLTVFRRAARRANFEPTVRFEPTARHEGPDASAAPAEAAGAAQPAGTASA